MATQAQINANRRNAKLSTGPRTDAGKAAVRQNALRHGCCSGMALMSEESESEFTNVHNILLEENQPVGANEEILVYMMAVQMHNFGRANLAICDALEAAEMDQQSVPPLPLALRYQVTAERSFRQNLSLLRKLQKERRLEEIGFDSHQPDEAPVEAPAEAPAEPPQAPAEAPETEPAAACQQIPPHIAAHPMVSCLVEALKQIDNDQVGPSKAFPKAA